MHNEFFERKETHYPNELVKYFEPLNETRKLKKRKKSCLTQLIKSPEVWKWWDEIR